MELFEASHQWSKRPDDQRFENLDSFFNATKAYAKTSAEKTGVEYSTLRVEAIGNELNLVGKGNLPAKLIHWSFGKLVQRAFYNFDGGAPVEYLRALPATLAAQNVNWAISQYQSKLSPANLLFHKNGGLIVRDIATDRYERFWNYEIAERLLDSQKYGWRVPPARPARSGQAGTRLATKADVLDIKGGGGLSINVGDLIAPAGIYASDHDMFVFLINESNRIKDGTPDGLSRGMFVRNSEVAGAARFSVARFLFRHVCGNHIVWDAEGYEEIAFKHIGKTTLHQKVRAALAMTLVKFANESASDQEAKVKSARTAKIAASRKEVLDLIFGKRILGLKAAEKAYDAVIPDVDGDPKTVYGYVQGITRASQETPYADERMEMDRAAAKVLAMAF